MCLPTPCALLPRVQVRELLGSLQRRKFDTNVEYLSRALEAKAAAKTNGSQAREERVRERSEQAAEVRREGRERREELKALRRDIVASKRQTVGAVRAAAPRARRPHRSPGASRAPSSAPPKTPLRCVCVCVLVQVREGKSIPAELLESNLEAQLVAPAMQLLGISSHGGGRLTPPPGASVDAKGAAGRFFGFRKRGGGQVLTSEVSL